MKELLLLLAESRTKAEEFGAEIWEYAVELDYIFARNFNINTIREALSLELCERRIEDMDADVPTRTFTETSSRLGLPKNSCFVITEEGLQYLHNNYCESSTVGNNGNDSKRVVPQWDREAGVLQIEGQIIKRFKRPAHLQFLVLDVFQEEQWPSFVHDPIPPQIRMDSSERLKGAKDGLNRRHQTQGIIRFGVRDGNKIGWVRLN